MLILSFPNGWLKKWDDRSHYVPLGASTINITLRSLGLTRDMLVLYDNGEYQHDVSDTDYLRFDWDVSTGTYRTDQELNIELKEQR